MIINIILLFFVLCYSNNAESVSLDLKTKIGNHLRRVLTQRSENYELVSHNYQFLFGVHSG